MRRKPRRFDRNLIVIGGGAAGLTASYVAASLKARVTLIERGRMGGDCLNTGCVPSKALLRAAQFRAELRRAAEFGFKTVSAEFDFAAVMARVQRVVAAVAPHDSAERYAALGVECLSGAARVLSPWEVEVNGRTLTARSLILATGARPFVPQIPGLEQIDPLTSDTVWGLRELPQRLLVVGGGAIGCELAQAFVRLGSRVTLVEPGPRLAAREDARASALLLQRLREEGAEILLNHKALEFGVAAEGKFLRCAGDGETRRIEFDQALIAAGRVANVHGCGLEALELELTPQGRIQVNDALQTRHANVYACGDAVGPYQLTHAAGHQGQHAAVNALFGGFKRMRVDCSVIPRAIFTDPQIAQVGLTEEEARARGAPYEVVCYEMSELDRAIVDGVAYGFLKALTAPGGDRILGVTIVAAHAGELIAEYALAMRQRIGLKQILATVHAYPTMAEANKYLAGAWRRAHAPQRLLRWLERYHRWRRGNGRNRRKETGLKG